jgi:multidrug efflux pump subunit AcrA (membrane-fusion protein)
LDASREQIILEENTLSLTIEQVEKNIELIDKQIDSITDLISGKTPEEQALDTLKVRISRLEEIAETDAALFENGLLPETEYRDAQTNLELARAEYASQEISVKLRKFENQKLRNDLIYQKTNLESELFIREASIAETSEKLNRAAAEKNNYIAEYRRNLQNDLVQIDKNIAQYKNEIAKGGTIIGYNTVFAPVSGEINGLSINTTGAVVQTSQVLLTIIPENAELVAETFLLNKDIGFVNKGQEVIVKVEAYPFQKFKTITGKVAYVSPNSYADENLGNVYKLKISLDDDYLTSDGLRYYVSPGMQVSAEVKIGKRRILDFFLEPVVKYLDESLKLR